MWAVEQERYRERESERTGEQETKPQTVNSRPLQVIIIIIKYDINSLIYFYMQICVGLRFLPYLCLSCGFFNGSIWRQNCACRSRIRLLSSAHERARARCRLKRHPAPNDSPITLSSALTSIHRTTIAAYRNGRYRIDTEKHRPKCTWFSSLNWQFIPCISRTSYILLN